MFVEEYYCKCRSIWGHLNTWLSCRSTISCLILTSLNDRPLLRNSVHCVSTCKFTEQTEILQNQLYWPSVFIQTISVTGRVALTVCIQLGVRTDECMEKDNNPVSL